MCSTVRFLGLLVALFTLIFNISCLVMPAQQSTRPKVSIFWAAWEPDLHGVDYLTPALPYSAKVRGVKLLRWAAGKSLAANFSADRFVEYWVRALDLCPTGIAIDEFGSSDPHIDAMMADALRRVRLERPSGFIVIWNAGSMTELLKPAYEAADLIILESYTSTKVWLDQFFGLRLKRARDMGFASKTMLAIAINDDRVARGSVLPSAGWANSADIIEAQLNWIAKKALNSPGVAFYASGASPSMLLKANQLWMQSAFRNTILP